MFPRNDYKHSLRNKVYYKIIHTTVPFSSMLIDNSFQLTSNLLWTNILVHARLHWKDWLLMQYYNISDGKEYCTTWAVGWSTNCSIRINPFSMTYICEINHLSLSLSLSELHNVCLEIWIILNSKTLGWKRGKMICWTLLVAISFITVEFASVSHEFLAWGIHSAFSYSQACFILRTFSQEH